MQRNVRDKIGVAVAKLKCPKPAPWIWTTGSPSPVSLYQMRTPLILASGIAFPPGRLKIATSISSDFHQGVGEPFGLIEHHDVVGVCFESVPRRVSLALCRRLVESRIRNPSGTNKSFARQSVRTFLYNASK